MSESQSNGRWQAVWNEQVIAESDDTVVVEGNHYFPAEALDQSLLEPSSKETFCPWKGSASYVSLNVNGKKNEDAAWVYLEPKDAAANIRGRYAFWRGVQVSQMS